MTVRQKLLAARYFKISEEQTATKYFISGLNKHATLTPILENTVASKPKTIRQLIGVFKSLQSICQPFQSSKGIQPKTQWFTKDYGTQSQFRPSVVSSGSKPNYYHILLQPRRQPYYVRHIPVHQLCTYHKSMDVRCDHTDAQCGEEGYPKLRFNKLQANYMRTDLYHTHRPYLQYIMASRYPQYPFHTLCPPHSHYQPILSSPAPQSAQVDITPAAGTENNATFVLDSGARATHIRHLLPHMQPQQAPSL